MKILKKNSKQDVILLMELARLVYAPKTKDGGDGDGDEELPIPSSDDGEKGGVRE